MTTQTAFEIHLTFQNCPPRSMFKIAVNLGLWNQLDRFEILVNIYNINVQTVFETLTKHIAGKEKSNVNLTQTVCELFDIWQKAHSVLYKVL